MAKHFETDTKKKTKVLHWGKVVSHRFDTDSELLFRMHCEDGDWEEMNTAEMIHTRLAAANDRGYDFTVPSAKQSRKKRKLAAILNHVKQTQLKLKDKIAIHRHFTHTHTHTHVFIRLVHVCRH